MKIKLKLIWHLYLQCTKQNCKCHEPRCKCWCEPCGMGYSCCRCVGSDGKHIHKDQLISQQVKKRKTLYTSHYCKPCDCNLPGCRCWCEDDACVCVGNKGELLTNIIIGTTNNKIQNAEVRLKKWFAQSLDWPGQRL